MSGGVRVEGLNRLVREMTALGVEVADLKAVFGKVSDQGAALARGFAPKRTGKLAASIKGAKRKNSAIVRAGSRRVPYASVINYGWPERNIRPARFLQRADEQLQPTVAKEIDAELSRLIRERGLDG